MQSQKILGKACRLRSTCCLVPVGTKDALPQTPVCALPPQYSSGCIGAVLRVILNARLLACCSPLSGPNSSSLAAALDFLRLHWVVIAVTVRLHRHAPPPPPHLHLQHCHAGNLLPRYRDPCGAGIPTLTISASVTFPSLVSSSLQSFEQN